MGIPPYLPPEKSICRSRSNGYNQTWNNGLVPNRERSTSSMSPWLFNLYAEFGLVHSVVSGSFPPHGLQHTRPPSPSLTPGVHPNSCPSSRWCHPNISSSVIPFSSCPQSFPASGSFPRSQFFPSGGQSIGASALTSVFPVYLQGWFPLGWTSWIPLQSKGLSRVFSSTTVWKHQFFGVYIYIKPFSEVGTISSPLLQMRRLSHRGQQC